MDMFIIVGLFLLGLIFGSFVNAWVWRLSQQLDVNGDPKKLTKAQKQQYSVVKGRSMCPTCKHQLSAKDLVPLFSWLSLKGKCRYCKAKIGKQYPLVELAMAIIFVASYIFWPFTLQGANYILFIGFVATLVPLFALALYDIKHYILPDKIFFPTVIFYALAVLLYSVFAKDLSTFGMALLSGVVYIAIFIVIYLLSIYANKKGYSKHEWLGFGDVKLVFLLGLVVGEPILVFIALFLASVTGIIVALPSMINHKMALSSRIPFGPYLILGAILAVFFGRAVISWYTNLLLGIV